MWFLSKGIALFQRNVRAADNVTVPFVPETFCFSRPPITGGQSYLLLQNSASENRVASVTKVAAAQRPDTDRVRAIIDGAEANIAALGLDCDSERTARRGIYLELRDKFAVLCEFHQLVSSASGPD